MPWVNKGENIQNSKVKEERKCKPSSKRCVAEYKQVNVPLERRRPNKSTYQFVAEKSLLKNRQGESTAQAKKPKLSEGFPGSVLQVKFGVRTAGCETFF